MKYLIFLFAFLSIFTSCTQDQKNTQTYLPASFESMQLMNFHRSYPNDDIPSDGFYKAYQQHIKMKNGNISLRNNDQWESRGPFNISGRVLSVGINPQADNTLYAGTASGGLWRSRSLGQGVSWERINTGFPVLGVSDIEFAPGDSTVMFIGTGEVYNYQTTGTDGAYRPTRGSYGIGILKSEDGGTTWTKSLDWTLQNERGVWMIKIDPINPQIVYAATTDGIYKSTDQGDSWNKVFDVLMATDVEIHPTRTNEILISCGNLNSAGKGIYKSTDSGQTWTKIESTLVDDFGGKIQLAFAPSNPDVVYASIGNSLTGADGASWIYKSDNFGTTWVLFNNQDYSKWQGWFSHDISVNPQNENEIIAVGISIWKNTFGSTFLEEVSSNSQILGTAPIGEPDGPPNYSHSDHHFVLHHPNIDDLVIFGNDGGVFLSFDDAETFQSANGGMQTTQFYNGFSVNTSGDIAMGGLQDNNTVLFTGDSAWTKVVSGDGSWTAINPENNNTIYGSSQNLRVRRSDDGGNSFFTLQFNAAHTPLFIAPYVLAPSNPNRMYFGSSTLFRSDNGGQEIFEMQNILPLINNPIYAMEVSPTDPNILYFATAPFPNGDSAEEPQVFFTINGGISFEETITDLPNRIVNDITIDPEEPSIAYIVLSGFGSEHLFKTTDFGQSWISIDNGLPDAPGNAVIVNPNNTEQIYYGNDIGVYISNDGGESWDTWDEGLPNASIVLDLKIAEEDNSVWISTHGNGTYKRAILDPFVSTQSVDVEEILIFPNPAIDQINLNADLQSNAKYQVIDVLGRPIINGTVSSLQIDISSLANGTYVLQIFTDDKILSGKFVKQ